MSNPEFKLFVEKHGTQIEVDLTSTTMSEAMDLNRAHENTLEDQLALVIGRRVLRSMEENPPVVEDLVKNENNELAR